MDKIDILLWVMGGGFTVLFIFLTHIYKELREQTKDLKTELKEDLKSLSEKLTDVDRRLCRLEGAFATKDCCMLKSDSQIKKAE